MVSCFLWRKRLDMWLSLVVVSVKWFTGKQQRKCQVQHLLRFTPHVQGAVVSTCCFSIPFVPRFLESQLCKNRSLYYTLISQWKVGNLFPYISKFLSIPLPYILLSAESLICQLDCRMIARNVQSYRYYKVLFLIWITQMRKY